MKGKTKCQRPESYDWALISMFDVLGIAMSVDCERDMREMFLWYQKYQMSGKRLSCKKMFGIIPSLTLVRL